MTPRSSHFLVLLAVASTTFSLPLKRDETAPSADKKAVWNPFDQEYWTRFIKRDEEHQTLLKKKKSVEPPDEEYWTRMFDRKRKSDSPRQPEKAAEFDDNTEYLIRISYPYEVYVL